MLRPGSRAGALHDGVHTMQGGNDLCHYVTEYAKARSKEPLRTFHRATRAVSCALSLAYLKACPSSAAPMFTWRHWFSKWSGRTSMLSQIFSNWGLIWTSAPLSLT